MRDVWRAVGLFSLGVLAGCATRQVSESVPALQGEAAQQAAAQQAVRTQVLRSAGPWSFSGRVAIQKAGKGGSGRIDWQHDAQGGDVISLSAPITRQQWQLVVSPDGAGRLDGLEGGSRSGASAERVLQEATQWEIPVRALSDWAQGLASSMLGEAVIQFGANGLPQQIQQDGWKINYDAWQTGAEGSHALPVHIQSVRDDAKVRLLIDSWQRQP